MYFDNTNPLMAFLACMVLTAFMVMWEWVETRDKKRVALCFKTSLASSIFLISMMNLLYLLFPNMFTTSKS